MRKKNTVKPQKRNGSERNAAQALPQQDDKPLNIRHLLLVVGLPLLVYAQVVGFDFSYHDDDVILLDGAQKLAAPFRFEQIFLTDAWLRKQQIELYRPLQSLSFWIDHQIFKTAASGYHLHNLILHLLNSVLVWLLLLLLTRRSVIAGVGALIWSLNFLNTHAVCWIPARGDLLLATWGCGFLIASIKILRGGRWYWYVLNVVAFFMALLSKENAVLLPVFAVVIYFFERKDTARQSAPKSYFGLVAGWLVAAAIYFRWRSVSIGTAGQNLSLASFFKNVRVLPEEIWKWWMPVKFSVMAGYDVALLAGGLVWLAVLLFLIKKRFDGSRAARLWILLGGLMLVLPLLPSMFYAPQFVSYGYDYLDHRIYFPSVGMALLAGWWLSEWSFFQKNRTVVGAALAAYFGVFAFFHAKHYKDKDAYYHNAIATNPRSGLALTNYGIIQRKAGKLDEAEKWFEKALAVAPHYDFLQAEMAILQNDKGNHARALELTEKLLSRTDPIRAEKDVIYCHRGFAKARLGRPAEAIEDFRKAVALKPTQFQYHQNLGSCYEDLNRSEEAIQAYTKALELNPNAIESWYRRGFQYGKTGKPQRALDDLLRAVALDANRREFYYFMALAFKDLNNFEKYCENMRRAAAMQLPEAIELSARFCQ